MEFKSLHHSYYSAPLTQFLSENNKTILGQLAQNHTFALEDLQRDAWLSQIKILKEELSLIKDAYIAFEYKIPRMGKRADVILIYKNIVFVLEFKVGASEYSKAASDQVLDYALDLKNFHHESHHAHIAPIVICTNALNIKNNYDRFDDNVYHPIFCNRYNIAQTVLDLEKSIIPSTSTKPISWLNSKYSPTPTIIEAAQAMYQNHSVTDITRADSGVINLSKTNEAITNIIEHSKANNRKSICFITGVPGAGKTLAGLNIANSHHKPEKNEHAVFLSGNGPLIDVLRESLAKNEVQISKQNGIKNLINDARRKTSVFIQNIHHFRDNERDSIIPPVEKISIFDEAQRAWNLKMVQQKDNPDSKMSEPEFLINVFDRHKDWAVIICLIGGGQEINKGEAGLSEWFAAIQKKFLDWDVYSSNQLSDVEYTNGKDLYAMLPPQQLFIKNDLHLAVSVRSFRTEKLALLIKTILDSKSHEAKVIFSELQTSYPIFITRNLCCAKQWLKNKSRGTESTGVVASSGAIRLKPEGIHVKTNVDPKVWFLNEQTDIRSSSFLEDVATEFDIQGLELDWTCVAWDLNLRRDEEDWIYKNFRGTKWNNIRLKTDQQYLINAYRVLLTRARQGMVIFIPKGDNQDQTRLPQHYDLIFKFLSECGIPTLT